MATTQSETAPAGKSKTTARHSRLGAKPRDPKDRLKPSPEIMQDWVYIEKGPQVFAERPYNTLLVFFITGNPGLAAYYEPFLTTLNSELQRRSPELDLFVHCVSLPGFNVNPSYYGPGRTGSPPPPYSLDEQIEKVKYQLWSSSVSANRWRRQGYGEETPLNVILIGHSVGAYILLEILRNPHTLGEDDLGMNIAGGICLFPTIVDIAKSSNGRMAAPLFRIPHLPLIVHSFAKLAFYFVPANALTRAIELLLGMPNAGAEVTARFLKSEHGVRQALHMARDELAQMTHDKWSDQLWGAASASDSRHSSQTSLTAGVPRVTTNAKLFFYWAAEDHWVANETRDAVIASRGVVRRGQGKDRVQDDPRKPVMEIDEHGVPHAFCLRSDHSAVVVEKVAGYVDEVLVSLKWHDGTFN